MPPVAMQSRYVPRPTQAILHDGMESRRWSCVVCHRRFGKTHMLINHLLLNAAAEERRQPRYAYIGPTYRQAKLGAWDILKWYAGAVPGVKINETELSVRLPNSATVRLFGADDPDSLRGPYLNGVVFDEFSVGRPDCWSTVIRPELMDCEGWAVFTGTPKGRNHFWTFWEQAKEDPEWFRAMMKASETGIIPPDELAAARRQMSQAEYDQEMECSFESGLVGAYWLDEISKARDDGRIGAFPVLPGVPVDTYWDIGWSDPSAVWFAQRDGGLIRVVDYYEAAGASIQHYADMLRARGYAYGVHFAPHDIAVHELGSGQSRLEIAASMGLRFRAIPPPRDKGASVTLGGLLLRRVRIDEAKCHAGITHLQGYRREWSEKGRIWKESPLHDEHSHAADAWQVMAAASDTGPVAVASETRARVRRTGGV